MILGPTGHELPFLAPFEDNKPKASRLSRFTKSAPEPTTVKEAHAKMKSSIARFESVGEGDGFNSALYGFVKDAARYYISMGCNEEEAYHNTITTVHEHPAYKTWGQMDATDETTFESAFDACLSEDLFWEIVDKDILAQEEEEEYPDPASLCEFEPETTILKHLWQNKMITGAVGLLVGDGGVGKSTVLMKVAAKISHGTLPGYFEGQKGVTLFYSMEDEQRAVFNPRMLASQADYRYIKFMGEEEDRNLQFPRDIDVLRRELSRHKRRVRLVVFDPLEAYMQQGARTNETKDVADLMGSLNQIAAEFDCCILGIKHFNKMQDSTLTHKVSGSTAYVNQSRFVLAAVKSESYEDDQRCVIGIFKGNTISPLVKGVTYNIETTTYKPTHQERPGDTGVTAYAKFLEESEDCVEVEDIKRQQKTRKDREGKKDEATESKSHQARLWFVTLLSKNGPMKFLDIQGFRDKSSSAPTKSTLEAAMREFVKEESRRKSKDARYLLDVHWVKELIEVDNQLPDGAPLPASPDARKIKIMEYRDRTQDGLLNTYCEQM